ncbi:MAG: HD domain-containing protein [Phycisphaerales bacterium]|nr:HD domain-containing protein [Phycisphaerales bacterium]
MLRVPIHQSRPGMILASPVQHPERHDTVLLRQGFVLDDAAVKRLRAMALPEVWIEYPGLAFVERHINPKVTQARAEVSMMIGRVIAKIQRDAKTKLEYPAYRRTVRGLLHKIVDQPEAAQLVQALGGGGFSMARHGADVCFLCLLMGLKLDTYLIAQRKRLPAHRAKDVVSLGLAGLLHDIGMLGLDEETRQRWRQNSDEQDEAWREHVRIGYERVQDGVDAPAASAILHHHQHYDGTGFPNVEGGLTGSGLQGQEIHVFARILAAADMFDRFQHPADAVAPEPAVRALARMRREPFAKWIDPVVFQALLAVAPAYPPGTIVRLSSGDRCAVVAWAPGDPCRPTVAPIGELGESWDGGGEEATHRIVLAERRDLRIVEVDGQDVREDNFYPTYPGEFDLPWTPAGLGVPEAA